MAPLGFPVFCLSWPKLLPRKLGSLPWDAQALHCVINAALPGAVSTRVWMQEKNSEGCPIINLVLMIPPKHEFIEEHSWQLLTKFRSQKSLLFAYELVLLLRKNVSLQAGWWSCGIVLLLRQDTLPLTLFLALFLLPTLFWNKLLVAELKSDPL